MVRCRHLRGWVSVIVLPVGLGACGTLAGLSEVGRPPRMTQISDPTLATNYRPVTMPMPPLQAPPQEAASLWRPGSRAFFKDQRAAQVGDLVTVIVDITDNASLNNDTTASRTSSEDIGIPNLFGIKQKFVQHLIGADTLSTSSDNSNVATGKINRNETVTLRLAGTITQVLPNGNFVVMARQEVRVNSELRELNVSGIVRPQDITADNTVTHDRMAEARISYGGRGTLTQLQQPRYGQQVMDAILPF
ncbi:flagellar basal body L-ring protein FlgH [Tanticharoenia sakaeratensis]|jgi:flagellar L-ring protein FlgH|uniref:Flagellar L-ring protein n=1 Tax=Tanticharoenia sakaeratensis NBRC 103193 TaxID=1231623 RepID=A0A0D6MMB4_9PROT|nr:flagellar basal body L-ring protein FlgH [Tanticharoenia sakaeratensis]GAN54570.1 flagellar basal body L-ring protein [Tanticharoenia sakaeratensis NBRC 103193]GBQ24401.1 flagellar basal body L-ring protein [Tanticharoenia sakaeratensis NBRC 103193]